MKKIVLSVVAASAMIFSTQTMNAQVANAEAEVAVEQTEQKAEWRQVEVAELPAEVQQAVERDFAGAVIAEAHVKEKEGEQKFKLVVQTAEGEQKELYADAQGNWIDKDKKDK
ncbi:hypothetical protein SAMN04488034_101739 [Salinimicrobium catena]|uniref:Beta-lactamase-inhibitor-like PepSY-like domain-containing protein n=1 Tax=Salinimicrobium catena TaxID=390640 RepID=A0A1H5JHM4_9FLAO|nr:hypothetical protein [Salinimicrobium catena]SDK87773.1 hypothetical protein SAMN04488140_101738 [Salinimicrobium catena]SEE52045.1 hypothetical protein SAMN04488034_101739 [Salinimicrobium catena]